MIHTHCVSEKTFNTNYKAFSKFFRSLNSTLKMKLIINSRKLSIYAYISRKTSNSFTLMKVRPFEYEFLWISSKLTKNYYLLNCSGCRAQWQQNYNPTGIFNQPTIHTQLKNWEAIPGTAHRRKLQLPQTSL